MHEAASFVMSARSLDEGLYLHSLPVTSLTFSASRSTSSLPPMHCTAVIKPLPDAEECFAGLLLNYINGSIRKWLEDCSAEQCIGGRDEVDRLAEKVREVTGRECRYNPSSNDLADITN